jgi:hypothetical protein
MQITKKIAYDLLEDLLKAEKKLLKWRQHGIGIVMTGETHKALSESEHPKKDFILHGVLVERRGKFRY